MIDLARIPTQELVDKICRVHGWLHDWKYKYSEDGFTVNCCSVNGEEIVRNITKKQICEVLVCTDVKIGKDYTEIIPLSPEERAEYFKSVEKALLPDDKKEAGK